MTYTIVGKKVGPIGYGMMGLTARPKPLSDEDALLALKTAVDAGCNWFNGGEFYGPLNNNSLTLLNKYYAKYPEDADKIVLNVKGGISKTSRSAACTREDMEESIAVCLKMLGPVGKIDQFEPARRDRKVDYIKETLATIDEHVKAGKVGAIAASELGPETLREASKAYKITSLEIEVSLFRTEPLTNGLLAACAELDIPVLAYSPLGHGFLGGELKRPEDIPEGDLRKHHPRYQGDTFYANLKLVEKVKALAQKKGVTTGQIAINWLLNIAKRPGMPKIIPIPGSSNPERIKENATIIDLTDEDLVDIDSILASFVPKGDRYPAALMADLDG